MAYQLLTQYTPDNNSPTRRGSVGKEGHQTLTTDLPHPKTLDKRRPEDVYKSRKPITHRRPTVLKRTDYCLLPIPPASVRKNQCWPRSAPFWRSVFAQIWIVRIHPPKPLETVRQDVHIGLPFPVGRLQPLSQPVGAEWSPLLAHHAVDHDPILSNAVLFYDRVDVAVILKAIGCQVQAPLYVAAKEVLHIATNLVINIRRIATVPGARGITQRQAERSRFHSTDCRWNAIQRRPTDSSRRRFASPPLAEREPTIQRRGAPPTLTSSLTSNTSVLSRSAAFSNAATSSGCRYESTGSLAIDTVFGELCGAGVQIVVRWI